MNKPIVPHNHRSSHSTPSELPRKTFFKLFSFWVLTTSRGRDILQLPKGIRPTTGGSRRHMVFGFAGWQGRRKFMKVNKELALDILHEMPQEKMTALHNALVRNCMLTSVWVLSFCDMEVYKEGWYLKFHGTRCSFSVFAKDNDGEFEFIRKPSSGLNLLYVDKFIPFSESDFDFVD